MKKPVLNEHGGTNASLILYVTSTPTNDGVDLDNIDTTFATSFFDPTSSKRVEGPYTFANLGFQWTSPWGWYWPPTNPVTSNPNVLTSIGIPPTPYSSATFPGDWETGSSSYNATLSIDPSNEGFWQADWIIRVDDLDAHTRFCEAKCSFDLEVVIGGS